MKKFAPLLTILQFVLILLKAATVFGQVSCTVQGVVRDLASNQTVPSVTLTVSGTVINAITDANGTFTLSLQPGSCIISFSHLAYNDTSLKVIVKAGNILGLGNIFMEPRVIGLEEVHVFSSFVTGQETPVAVTTVGARTIEKQSGNQDYPEILKMTPGVYATKAGGGSGDDRLTIRGFQQENVALLLNGVPVSSMENGLVYWSNWSGLADATEAIQVQRGLGASNVAMNSVGGTVNIITKSTLAQAGGVFRYCLSDYGNRKTTLQLSTGRMKNGSSITFLGSHTEGPGYVDGTYVKGWSYFLSVSREFGTRHKLVFTALGSPESHGQRNYGMSKADFDNFGNKYNPSWGLYNGKLLNLSENFYHKPQLSLNHYWDINPKTFLASSAYLSFGNGGGRYSEAFNYGTPVWNFRKNNQIDFDAVYLDNAGNKDSTLLSDGNWVKGYSKNVLTNYMASHYWAGLMSTLTRKINENTRLMAGIHLRTFRSHLYEQVADLMGGNSWVEQYAWSLSGVAGRSQIKKVGDVINVDNYSIMQYGNLFGQVEYKLDPFRLFAAATVSATQFQREDPYNYPGNPYSAKVRKTGFNGKAGMAYKLGKQGSIYANLGFYSREPLFTFVFVNFSNAVARNLRNEKISTAEIGYEFTGGRITSRLNGYYTLWKDKSILSRENIQLTDSSLTRSLVRGLNALHTGIEWEISALLYRNLSLSGTVSIGNWKWQNDVTASIYNDKQVLVDSLKIYTRGLFVGDAPQTQLGLSLDYTFFKQFNLVANWVYYDRLYANFDPTNRTNPDDRQQPYRIPAYGIFDLHTSYEFVIRQIPASVQLSCQNVFNNQAITRGDDGADHSLAGFTGFWAMGRTFNLSLKLSF